MSKNRGQSLKRSVNRALKGREKGITAKGEITYKSPRFAVEFMDTLNKVFVFKLSSCGSNRAKTRKRKRQPRPQYHIFAQV